tara:strand:- start:1500 stop:2282 length:783 start_codon:yes stop_codon:yes gene_type:complete
MKTLKLTSPLMRSDMVLAVQKKLRVRTDGVYGPVTAGAVKRWKWAFGYHKKFVNQDFTASDYAYLFATRPKTALMKVRTSRRSRKPAPPVSAQSKALKIMQTWAAQGLKEQPAGSNKVPRLHDIAKAKGISTYYSNMGYPWCAFAVMLAAHNAGSSTAKAGFAGKFNVLYVPDIEAQARSGRHGMRLVGWPDARPGDFLTFNWDGGVPDHIGMLVGTEVGYAVTVEGNTSSSTGGSQSNGGGVYIRHRDRSVIQSIIRWT